MRQLPLPIPQKEAICQQCVQRTCCYHYKVPITGHDLWRIAGNLNIAPIQFAVYLPAEPENETAFVLDESGAHYELVLGKTAEPRRHGGCLFLLRTNDGAHRCGLGAVRPAQCRIYPVYVQDDLLRVFNDKNGCWRTWSLTEIDAEQERRRSREYGQARLDYRQIVTEWNRRVWASGGREFGFHEFCDYLQNRYSGFAD